MDSVRENMALFALACAVIFLSRHARQDTNKDGLFVVDSFVRVIYYIESSRILQVSNFIQITLFRGQFISFSRLYEGIQENSIWRSFRDTVRTSQELSRDCESCKVD